MCSLVKIKGCTIIGEIMKYNKRYDYRNYSDKMDDSYDIYANDVEIISYANESSYGEEDF